MKQIDYRNRFRKSAKAYDKLTQSKHISLIYELEKQVLAGFLPRIDAETKTVMDFACGTGRWTRFLEKYFKQTTGVDVSEQMIALALNKCKKADFVLTDITSEPLDEKLKGQQFDVVTAFRFYKNAQMQLREEATEAISKYLKKDGFFIFDLHLNSFSFIGIMANIIRFFNLHKFFNIGELGVKTISLGEIRSLFKNTPFEIVDYYGMGVLPGRSNFVILPRKLLQRIESFFTNRKLFRGISYTILVVAIKR